MDELKTEYIEWCIANSHLYEYSELAKEELQELISLAEIGKNVKNNKLKESNFFNHPYYYYKKE